MNEIPLTIAISDYDHVREIGQGRIPTPGMKLTFLDLEIPEINGRFALYKEWHISECGLGKYVALRSSGDDSITAIPVFPTRFFRHSAFYVRDDSPLHGLRELPGKRVGIPEWAQTATVYGRGILAEDCGIDLASIEWVQAGINEPGRIEKVKVALPPGVKVEARPKDTLQGMLLDGQIDCILAAMPPDAYLEKGGGVRRLLADPQAAEEDYYQRTGIFPIMHVIAIRRDVYDVHPWVATNLVRAFQEAKRRSMARVLDQTSWSYPAPFINYLGERSQQVFGEDFFPYGIEPNRLTLEAFLRFAHDQGVAHRRLEVEELFAPTTLKLMHV